MALCLLDTSLTEGVDWSGGDRAAGVAGARMRARGTYTPGSGFGRVARRVLRNQRDTLGQREKSTEREREKEGGREGERGRASVTEKERGKQNGEGEARRVKAS